MTTDLKSEGDDEKAFEKALKETAVYYYNRLNKVVEDMSDVQRQEYKRSVNIAFSLVDPYRSAVRLRDEAKTKEQLYWRDGSKMFWGGLVASMLYMVIEKIFFTGTSFVYVVAMMFVIVVLYGSFIAFTVIDLRYKQLIYDSDRGRYLQQWNALGLDWKLLSLVVQLENNQDSYQFLDHMEREKKVQRQLEIDKVKVPFEVKENLALAISGRIFLIDFRDLDSNDHRDWDGIS